MENTDKYDTDIEKLFYQKLLTSIKNDDYREKIKEAWVADKLGYIEKLKTVEFEFMNYSLHDHTHSQSILQNIYQWLGKERASKLSIGDLWLILEAAYSHDIGMATTYLDLEELWKDKQKIKDLITEINFSADRETIESLSSILENPNDKSIFAIISEDTWPLKVRKAVTYINATYFRKMHSKFSKKYILSKTYGDENSGSSSPCYIENRFYDIVADIDFLHTQDYKKIEELLEVETDGFDTSDCDDDKIHPQMVAHLLRLGDVLDIKNNRFDQWVVNHNGELPKNSKLHFQKHQAVKHFLVTPRKIEITIKSNSHEVCVCASEWFNWIEEELKLLTRKWNNVAPEQLKGFLMENWNLKVYYKGTLFNSKDFSKELTTNSEKLMDLLSGKNIYRTKLVLFREYIQNAIDATKVKFATYYYENQEFLDFIKPKSFKDITIQDIKMFNESVTTYNKLDIKDLTIKILIEPKGDTHCIVRIIDQGIGMDDEGLDALFNIGKGWSGRSIRKKFNSFPEWLNPTGGFGIGMLSGFLLCDSISIETKSKKTPQYLVEINSPNNGGKVSKKTNFHYYGDTGTTISFELSYFELIKEMQKFINLYKMQFNASEMINEEAFKINDKTSLQLMTQQSTYCVLEYYIDFLIFPIEIYAPFLKKMLSLKKNMLLETNTKLIFDDTKNQSTYWDKENECMVSAISNLQKKTDNKLCVSYKGIHIDVDFNLLKEKYKNSYQKKQLLELSEVFLSFIDINFDTVDEILEITRDQLKDDSRLLDLLDKLLYNYLRKLAVLDFSIIPKISEEIKKKINELILYYYKYIVKRPSIFISLIKSINNEYYYAEFQLIKKESLFVLYKETFEKLTVIFNYLSEINSDFKTARSVSMYFRSTSKKYILLVDDIMNNIEKIIDSDIIINEAAYEYFSNIHKILNNIRNSIDDFKNGEKSSNVFLSSLEDFINCYSSDIEESTVNVVSRKTFLELLCSQDSFYVICEARRGILATQDRVASLTNKHCLFVDKKEFDKIEMILKNNSLDDYRSNRTYYRDRRNSYDLLYIRYFPKNEKNDYENLIKNMRENLSLSQFFPINDSSQFLELKPIIVSYIPYFDYDLTENKQYIINPLQIVIIKQDDDILNTLKNKNIRKKELGQYLLNKPYFKIVVEYIMKINGSLQKEIVDCYVKLFCDIFDIS